MAHARRAADKVMAPPEIPRLDTISLDGRVLLFTTLLSIFTGPLSMPVKLLRILAPGPRGKGLPSTGVPPIVAPMVVAVHPGVPAGNLKELIAANTTLPTTRGSSR